MLFQRLIVSVADRQSFVIPYLPAGFVQRRYNTKYSVPVLVRIADEYVRLFFIRRERGGKFFDSGRKQSVKRLVLIVEHE